MSPSAIFESFNAKNLRPDQVAKTFVPPSHFKTIAKRRHTIIIGPRGSGKTSLLKMLQVEALDAWNADEAKEYKSSIDFHGAFIATDRVFKEQVESLQFEVFEEFEKECFAISIFATHVFRSLASAFEYTTRGENKDRTSRFVEGVSLAWDLNLKSYSFDSLLSSLTIRKSKIPSLVNRLKHLDRDTIKIEIGSSENSFLHVDLIQSVNAAIELYSQYFEDGITNWALLFDELELAPSCVVKKLLEALRGSNDRLILKLSMAPYSPDTSIVKNIFSAATGHDYDQVVLWNPNKVDSNTNFTESLVKSMLVERDIDVSELDNILATPPLQLRNVQFQELFKQDSSFRKYIRQRKIDINSLESITGNNRNELIGKVSHIVKIRLAALNFKNENTVLSSLKKLPEMYAGKNMLFDILEGNPRLIIGVFGTLLDEYQVTKKKIRTQRQLDEIKSAINKFFLFLKSIPVEIDFGDYRPEGVDSLINNIGSSFKNSVLSREFIERPVGSFIVDKGVSKSTKSVLGAALNAGALVHLLGDDSDVFLGDLEGHKFRLSFLISPKYSLPISVLKEAKLSKLLIDASNKNDNNYQLEFPNDL